MPMVRKLTAWVALEGQLSSSASARPPGSTCGTFSSNTRRVAAMAKTPSLKASVRLVLTAPPVLRGSYFRARRALDDFRARRALDATPEQPPRHQPNG